MSSYRKRWIQVVLAAALVASACGVSAGGEQAAPTEDTLAKQTVEYDIERDPDVPSLPFDDNPDPAQCGIPVQWGGSNSTAWLSGEWEGELIQPDVLVYDSHLRVSVTGGAPHGTEVTIVLYQENHVLDYYFVRLSGEPAQEGWVPAPFLSFEPVT